MSAVSTTARKCEVCSGPYREPLPRERELIRYATKSAGEELENERDYLRDLIAEHEDPLGLAQSTLTKLLKAAQLYGEQKARGECAGLREEIYNVR